MSENDKKKVKSKISNFFQNIKGNKKSETIVVILLVIVAIFIYTSASSLFKSNESTTNLSTNEYVNQLEQRLSKVLSNVKGAGNVSVMITVEGGSEITIATSTEEKVNSTTGTTSNQSSTIKEEPIIIGNQPVVLIEKYPTIKGVIVVATGANNIQVRLELLKAVQAVLEVDANDVEVFIGN